MAVPENCATSSDLDCSRDLGGVDSLQPRFRLEPPEDLARLGEQPSCLLRETDDVGEHNRDEPTLGERRLERRRGGAPRRRTSRS